MANHTEGRPRLATKAIAVIGVAALLAAGVAIPPLAPARAQTAASQDDTAQAEELNLEALRLFDNGQYHEAESVALDALALAERVFGVDHPKTATRIRNLGEIQTQLGRYEQAERSHRRALAIRELHEPENARAIADSLNSLAEAVRRLGRLDEAEALQRRALAIYEQSGDQADIARGLTDLAHALTSAGRFGEAEWLYLRALAIREQTLPENDPAIAQTIGSLAELLRNVNRMHEAESLLRRAMAIYEHSLPAGHPYIATSLNNLAAVLLALERPEEAEPIFRRSLALREDTLPAGHPYIAQSLNNLGSALSRLSRYDEAEQVHRRALAIRQQTLPENHPDIAESLNNLAGLFFDLDRVDEAENHFRHALAIWERALPQTHPNIVTVLESLALVMATRAAWDEAGLFWDKAARIRTAPENRTTLAHHNWREQAHRRIASALLVRERDGESATNLVIEARTGAFLDLQWERASGAGGAIAAATARAAADPRVAPLARERDRLLDEVRDLDSAIVATSSNSGLSRELRSAKLSDLRVDGEEARQRLAALAEEIAQRFPAYSELAEGLPLAVGDLLPLLADDEVLLSVTPYGKNGFLYAMSRDGGRFVWLPEAADAAMLAKRLRCSAANGLDTSCKTPAAAGADAEVSRGAVATRGGEAEDTRFDLELAHDLYRRLFPEQVRDFVRGKKLVIAPAPELMGLPWHLLVTEAPPPGWDDRRAERIKAYREARWLFQSHPSIAVLPTIASLRALRGMAPQRSSADRAFLGIGDPAIGRTAMEREAAPMDCRQGEDSIVLAGIDPAGFGPRSAAASPAAIFTGARDERGFALADVDLVRSQPRLPDTRCELMSVAASLESERTDLLLGTDAAETTIRDLDDSGALARYRILHFATHGLLGGELGLGEPGLVLTPPEKADTQDDGILSASEVAALSLAAEWVVLSACNTAAGSGADAEALSGLARAFFYAGAKSLLVSSWPVYSAAAVSITTAAFDAMKDDPKMGRAEAVTRAMRVTLAAASDEHTAHPAYWGPFFLVGEGMR